MTQRTQRDIMVSFGTILKGVSRDAHEDATRSARSTSTEIECAPSRWSGRHLGNLLVVYCITFGEAGLACQTRGDAQVAVGISIPTALRQELSSSHYHQSVVPYADQGRGL